DVGVEVVLPVAAGELEGLADGVAGSARAARESCHWAGETREGAGVRSATSTAGAAEAKSPLDQCDPSASRCSGFSGAAAASVAGSAERPAAPATAPPAPCCVPPVSEWMTADNWTYLPKDPFSDAFSASSADRA